ncbi:MAG: Zn-dependent oligopeptidase [Candidatus Actinomarina sp.]|nr:Zn-dependent oligopeptidase [Candidatus Actinomarina sp.]MDA2946503.1 Zn-dependent oligopeptidase [Actinomycetota bacterium]MBL6762708.1 Zn-dependent oligopeptidase [Candidatus Actinomarina sp.]MBL6835916.1 Zn-dependent oligopeptidase [Candidatus Actinomarina sp.]MDA3008558.1 Zn-dependent oligopeptidase [Actinomycetota bacterium]
MYNYSDISLEKLEEDLIKTIEECKDLVSNIKSSENIDLSNFNELESIIYDLSGRIAFMGDVHPDEKIRDFGNEADSKIQNLALEIFKDQGLYKKIKEIQTNNLDEESKTFFKDLEIDFKDAGHGLSDDKKNRLTEIEKKLIDLSISFSENIARDKTEVLFSEDELKGLSQNELKNLRKNNDSFVITMAYPDINAVMENCSIRTTREIVWKAFNNRSVKENSPILEEAVQLRNEKALLFGFKTWAEYRLQNRMAKSPKNVASMYESLIPKLQKAAEVEKSELAIDNIEITDISPWDVRYFISKERSEVSSIENSELKKYFYIHNVKTEMFKVCEEVFDLQIKPESNETAWHEDVELWSLWEKNGQQLAYFYLDLYPREGKFTHAAVFDISSGGSSRQELPICSMVANFPNPNTGDGLMTLDEVETLFHEFGHVLHNGVGKSKYTRFVGANCEWDFVEAPSQIMEHWVWKVDCMKRISKHIETGDSLSEEICEKLNKSKNIGVSLLTLRQVSFGLADQHLHGENYTDSLLDVEYSAQKVTTITYPKDINHLAAFGHLLGGYDAAYYGYLWAEIIGDDLFSRFENEGVLSKSVGVDYKNKILRPGGTVPAEIMVKDFLGRKWNDEAFLSQKNLSN